MITQAMKSYIKKDYGMWFNNGPEGMQQNHCKIEGCFQSRNII